jgi:hypothetical protein
MNASGIGRSLADVVGNEIDPPLPQFLAERQINK